MYREKLEEIRKEKKIPLKTLAEESGVSTDTISNIIRPQTPTKDSPRVNTLERLCEVLGVELWELFFTGNASLVSLQAEIDALKAEIDALKAERDALIAENGALKSRVETLRDKVDLLKDEIIATHNYYIKKV